jgi:phosphocarrier protein
VVVVNVHGLHARPVMQFVDLASQFESAITVQKGDLSVDGREPMEMMLLEATQGTELVLVARGQDADAAIAALAALITGGFGES